MKAVVATKYGSPDVLKLTDVEKPVPQNNEILVKVYATTVTAGDSRVRSFNVPRSLWLPARLTLGLTKPKKSIPGMVLAGEIEAVGAKVTEYQVGDAIYVYDITQLSAYAEYACIPVNSAIALKPPTLTYEESAALPFGGVTALYFLKKGNIQRGQQVLIYGASGSVGTSAIQLAKHFGAEVTAVCSTTNIELVKSLGADYVIDYTQEDFTKNGKTYDTIFDTVGKTSLSPTLESIRRDGSYLQVGATPTLMIQMLIASKRTGKTLIGGTAYPTKEYLEYLSELVETGAIKPVIDRCYPLEQIIEAHRYVDTGHKKGDVVITIAHNGKF